MADVGAGQISGTLDFVDRRHPHAEVFFFMAVNPGLPTGLWTTRNRRIGAVSVSRRATPSDYIREMLGAAREGVGGEISRTFCV
jgi:hypothetical protein